MSNPDLTLVASTIAECARKVSDDIKRAGMPADIAGRVADGDIKTAADQIGAQSAWSALQQSNLRCALILEDTGQLEEIHPDYEWIAIVDELDGSRPARLGSAGQSLCSVNIALIPADREPTLRNVEVAVIHSLDDHSFVAIRNQGVKRDGKRISPIHPAADTLESAMVFNEHMGNSPLLASFYQTPFIATNKAGHLIISSSSCAARFLAEGRIDLHVHLGRRLWETYPQWRKYLVKPDSKPAAMMPYDLAAYYFVLTEAGCRVTDGFGHSLEDVELDSVTAENQKSVIAARSPRLHEAVLAALEQADIRISEKEQLVSLLLQ